MLSHNSIVGNFRLPVSPQKRNFVTGRQLPYSGFEDVHGGSIFGREAVVFVFGAKSLSVAEATYLIN